MEPIWKDYFYMLTDSPEEHEDGIRYAVLRSSDMATLFEGRAYPRPTDSELYVRLNDIVEPYLQAVLPLEGVDRDNIGIRVEVIGEGVGNTITFTRDWSYDRSHAAGENPTRTIVKRVHPLQYLPQWADDEVFFVQLHFTTAVGDYSEDYSPDYFVHGSRSEDLDYSGNGTTHFFNMAEHLGAESVTIDGEVLPISGCERFILYYVNAYGGWDWLPVEGKTKEADAITRHTYDASYDNRTAMARGRFNHVNELQHRFTFYTGLLTDAQSELMHHLLNSVLVYVHDTKTGEVLPLVLMGSTTEHKQSGLNQYTIEAELAQQRLRR